MSAPDADPFGSPNPVPGTGPQTRPAPEPATDPIPVVALVLSLLCCTSFLGPILGMVALRRTKAGARGGRGTSIAAVVFGALGTLGFAGVFGALRWLGENEVFEYTGLGQCLSLDGTPSPGFSLFTRGCGIGFGLGLLGCASLAFLILGIVAKRRAAGARTSSAWTVAAFTAGSVVTSVLVASVGIVAWLETSSVSVRSAAVGQCVDDVRLSDTEAVLLEQDCDEPHDAEVTTVAEFTAEDVRAPRGESVLVPQQACYERLSGQYATALATHQYEMNIVHDADKPEVGDPFVCYLALKDGEDLDAPISD